MHTRLPFRQIDGAGDQLPPTLKRRKKPASLLEVTTLSQGMVDTTSGTSQVRQYSTTQ
jgi:hypothetical protein